MNRLATGFSSGESVLTFFGGLGEIQVLSYWRIKPAEYTSRSSDSFSKIRGVKPLVKKHDFPLKTPCISSNHRPIQVFSKDRRIFKCGFKLTFFLKGRRTESTVF